MPGAIDILLENVPQHWLVEEAIVGEKWTISVVTSPEGIRAGGLASAPRDGHAHLGPQFANGHDAAMVAALVKSTNPAQASLGMATINALLRPPENNLSKIDAADWLVQNGAGKGVAVVGRFPFIEDELSPIAGRVWVFERDPEPDEFGADDMPAILPKADIVAITGSTFANHTIDDILPHISPHSTVMILGPSTPLSPALFAFGIDLLSGVRVDDIDQAMASVRHGVSFRHMNGVRRVTLGRDQESEIRDQEK